MQSSKKTDGAWYTYFSHTIGKKNFMYIKFLDTQKMVPFIQYSAVSNTSRFFNIGVIFGGFN